MDQVRSGRVHELVIQVGSGQLKVAHVQPCSNAWFPPFRCRFAVPLCRAVVPLPFFRSVATVAVAGENGNAGNIFAYT